MQIVYNSTFRKNFNDIWDYIAQDSHNRANSFKSKLKNTIQNIPNFPYKYRKSFYYDSEYVRDCIFKGYTIPYLIDSDKNIIIILDIFKWSKR